MTTEEAIQELRGYKQYCRTMGFRFNDWREALDMAIEALSVKRTGKWNHPYHYGLALPEHQCSECGYWEYADSKSNFCPNCGADMRERREDDEG